MVGGYVHWNREPKLSGEQEEVTWRKSGSATRLRVKRKSKLNYLEAE